MLVLTFAGGLPVFHLYTSPWLPCKPQSGMSAVPGPSRPTTTTPLLASPRGVHQPRDLSAVRYHSLPSLGRLPSKRHRHVPHVQVIPCVLLGAVFVFAVVIAWDVSSYGKCYFRPLCRILGDGNESMREVWWKNSGPYATWKPVGPGGGRNGLPRGCEIDQVNVVRGAKAMLEFGSAWTAKADPDSYIVILHDTQRLTVAGGY